MSATANNDPTKWNLFASQNGVEIYYKYAQCDLEMGYDQEWVLLRFVNTAASTKTVKYHKIMEINGVCKTCNDPNGEYSMTVVLRANETIEGSCTVYDNAAHHIFSKMTTPNTGIEDKLTAFDLRNLTVTYNE
ncbi:MAG: hypothetical protein COA57_13330 [Flavobacteriales bacterium]|nr:MAG: hypothetical protein COA57_13330 [Flavobacteriales bacterium]